MSWSAAAASERRSCPTACTRKPAASWSIVEPWLRTSAATKPENLRRLELAGLRFGDRLELAQLGQHAAALLAAAVDEHERDVLDGRGGVRQQPLDGLLGEILQAAHDDAADAREERGR